MNDKDNDAPLTLTLSGHGEYVRCCAVFAGDKKIVSGSDDKTLKIWDVDTGRCERTLSGHGTTVHCCAVLAGDKKIVSGSVDKTLKIWDASSYFDKWYLMRQLQRAPSMVCDVSLLNACTEEVESVDIVACACLDLRNVQSRWSVLQRESFLTSWLEAELDLGPIDVSELMKTTSTDALDTKVSIVRHLLFGRKEVQVFIQRSVRVSLDWPASWKTPWMSLAGMGLAPDEEVPALLVWRDEQVASLDNDAQGSQSANIPPDPLWTPMPFRFTPLIGQELPDDDGSKVKFKNTTEASTASKDGGLENTSSLSYKFDIDVYTRGSHLNVALVDVGTQSSLIEVKISGGGSRGSLHVSCVGKDNVRTEGSIDGSKMTLELDLASATCIVKSSDSDSSAANQCIRSSVTRPADGVQINFLVSSKIIGSWMKVVCYKRDFSQLTSDDIQSSNNLSVKGASGSVDAATKLVAQKDFLQALLTEKMQVDDVRKYDETVAALIKDLHDHVVGSSWALQKAVSMKLHKTINRILDATSDEYHLVLPTRDCMIKQFSEDPEWAIKIIEDRLEGLLESMEIYRLETFSKEESEDDRIKIKTALESKEDTIFSFSSEDTEDCVLLSRAFVMANRGDRLAAFAADILKKLEGKAVDQEGFLQRQCLLLKSRLLRKRKEDVQKARDCLLCYLLLGWRQWYRSSDRLEREDLLDNVSLLVSPEDEQLLNASTSSPEDSSTSLQEAKESHADPKKASELWEQYKKSSQAKSDHMDKLMKLVAIEEAKGHALQVYKMMRASKDLPDKAKVKVTLNFVFYGNPGTGAYVFE